LSINFEKTSLLQFSTKNSSHIPISVGCDDNIKYNITNITFLGITVDYTLTCKSHIEMTVLKLSVACFALNLL